VDVDLAALEQDLAAVGGWTPTSDFTSVLFPAPLSPTSATTSCG
jgi:hypothetical protein